MCSQHHQERISELSRLTDGWLDGEGAKVTEVALHAGRDLLRLWAGLLKPCGLFPTVEGGLSFESDCFPLAFEITVTPEGEVAVTCGLENIALDDIPALADMISALPPPTASAGRVNFSLDHVPIIVSFTIDLDGRVFDPQRRIHAMAVTEDSMAGGTPAIAFLASRADHDLWAKGEICTRQLMLRDKTAIFTLDLAEMGDDLSGRVLLRRHDLELPRDEVWMPEPGLEAEIFLQA